MYLSLISYFVHGCMLVMLTVSSLMYFFGITIDISFEHGNDHAAYGQEYLNRIAFIDWVPFV